MFQSILVSSALLAVGQAARAAYFLENNPAGSNIVALELQNGYPSNPVRTSTGGKGALSVGAAADTLGSEGAVVVSGNKLFTVNAGSNTLAYFEINPYDPYHPTLITAVDTLGEFPISVAYSDRESKVCVLNGGAKSGVACFDFHEQWYGGGWQGYAKNNILQADGPLRSIPLNETTPPTGPPGSAAQVGFVGGKIVVTLKGSPQPGSMVVFDGQQKRIYQNPDILLDFGFSALDDSNILMSDVSDAWVINVDTFAAEKVPLNASASCWVTLDGQTGYVMDAGKNFIYKVINGKLAGSLALSKAGGGAFDAIVTDGKLNALVVNNGILTIDLASQQETLLDLSSFGNRLYYQGLAAW